MRQTFDQITGEQIQEFNVNSRVIRMDTKLIGSNIAFFSRYELIHHSLRRYCRKFDSESLSRLTPEDEERLRCYMEEKPGKVVYENSREEIQKRLRRLGSLIYTILTVFSDKRNKAYDVLERVFKEQYEIKPDNSIAARNKIEISSESVQSPDDPDCSFRSKAGENVKGYSVNITETCLSKNEVNLITNVIIDKANTADSSFVPEAIESTSFVTKQAVERSYQDGAYQSPNNDTFCKEIEMVYTGIQGKIPRYDLKLTEEGLLVTDTITGNQMIAVLAKRRRNSRNSETRWRVKTEKEYRYFTEKEVRSARIRAQIRERSEEENHRRNNVEATIFQMSYSLRQDKTRYRGLFKQRLWAYCRCLWVNLVRITIPLKEKSRKALKSIFFSAGLSAIKNKLASLMTFMLNISPFFSRSTF